MALNDLGDVPASSVLPVFWTSHDGTTGANETMSALAVGDILIYKGVSMTQRSSTAGFTLLDTDGIDIDTLTGVNAISIDLSDNTDAGFYAAGSFYNVILGPVTIDAQTVYIHLATFRIVAAEGIAGTPKSDVAAWLGTAAATPTVAGVPEVDVTHWLGTAAATPTTAGVPEVDVTHVSGTAQTAGDLKASLNTIDDFVDGLETTIGAAGAGLTAIPWNAAWDAEVQSEVDDALVAQRLDELLNADSDIDGAAPPTVGSVIHEMLTKTAGSFTYDQTTDSQEAIRDKLTDIETDTAEIGAAGAGLTAADDAILAAIAALNNLSSAQAATAVGAIVIEGAVTLIQSLRLANAANAGKVSGAATTTVILRDLADSLDRITATVDVDGNRTAITTVLT